MTNQTLEAKAVELLDKMQDLAEPAMQVALRALQAGAIMDLVLSVAALAVVLFVAQRVLPGWWKDLKEADFNDELSAGIRFWGSAILSTVFGVIAAIQLLSTSMWLAIFAPELAMARMLISKFT